MVASHSDLRPSTEPLLGLGHRRLPGTALHGRWPSPRPMADADGEERPVRRVWVEFQAQWLGPPQLAHLTLQGA